MTAPVMNAFLNKNTIASATSSARRMRPTAAAFAPPASGPPGRVDGAGRYAFTRRGFISAASTRTVASITPLMEARPAVLGLARRAEMAVTNVIEPSRRIVRRLCCAAPICAQNLSSNPRRNDASPCDERGVGSGEE